MISDSPQGDNQASPHTQNVIHIIDQSSARSDVPADQTSRTPCQTLPDSPQTLDDGSLTETTSDSSEDEKQQTDDAADINAAKAAADHGAENQDSASSIYRESIKTVGSFSTFGLNLLFASVIGYFIGKWLDNLLDTHPVFTIIWVVSGVIFAFLELAKVIIKASRLGDPPASDETGTSHDKGSKAP